MKEKVTKSFIGYMSNTWNDFSEWTDSMQENDYLRMEMLYKKKHELPDYGIYYNKKVRITIEEL